MKVTEYDRRERHRDRSLVGNTIPRLMETIKPDWVVVDVGGGGCPFNRADYVVDIRAFNEEGGNNSYGPKKPRFTKDTYIQQDICSTRLPFPDKSIDFAICSHTLEDIREPLLPCAEMIRVAKRGYIECPSRIIESIMNLDHPRVAGSPHHRWFVELLDGGLIFTFKSGFIYSGQEYVLPNKLLGRVKSGDRVMKLWWEDSFVFAERIHLHGNAALGEQREFVQRIRKQYE